ncbi:hypothetical protein FB451DRAFT_1176714 [Mycena latifolia]|nr:hypothetical protein FB451DRAFT_1176714 [Mycena latifolia]
MALLLIPYGQEGLRTLRCTCGGGVGLVIHSRGSPLASSAQAAGIVLYCERVHTCPYKRPSDTGGGPAGKDQVGARCNDEKGNESLTPVVAVVCGGRQGRWEEDGDKRTREKSWKRAKGDWEPRTGGGKKNSRKTSHLHLPIDSSGSRGRFVRTGTGKPSEEETKCAGRPERESVVHEVCGIREPQDIGGAVVQYRRRINWVPAVPNQANARSESEEPLTRPSALSSPGA